MPYGKSEKLEQRVEELKEEVEILQDTVRSASERITELKFENRKLVEEYLKRIFELEAECTGLRDLITALGGTGRD